MRYLLFNLVGRIILVTYASDSFLSSPNLQILMDFPSVFIIPFAIQIENTRNRVSYVVPA